MTVAAPWTAIARRLGLALLLLAAAGGTGAAPVLVLSFDGLSARHFGPGTLPETWALAAQGLRGRGLPPFPSTTFNGHATIATGTWPERHGIVANALVDPRLGFRAHAADAALLQAEPLWASATRSGLRAAVIGWPCGEGPWQGVAAWRMVPYRPDWRDDAALAACASALDEGADLVMGYLSGIDEEAHRHGPWSRAVREKLRATDRLLAPWLRARLRAQPGLRVWLLADHGSSATPRRVCLPSLLSGIPCRIITHGGSATLHLANFRDLLPARRRLRRAGLRAWTRSELPEGFHLKGSDRCGDLVVLAPSGAWLAQHATGPEAGRERAGRAGCHGFAPDHPEMAAWVVLLGTGRRGSLGTFPLWDVAPTVAAQLGLGGSAPRTGRVLPRAGVGPR